MRILVVGATGTIGSEIVSALSSDHEVVGVTRHTPVPVDISNVASIRAMYEAVGKVDAVVSAAGGTRRKPFLDLTDDDYAYSVANKLMGQVNLVRYGIDSVRDGGSFTLTTGILGRAPIPGSEAISLANLGLEGFMLAASRDMPRGIRVNVVSPPWAEETIREYNLVGFTGLPSSLIARAYVASVTGSQSGQVIEP